MMFRKRVFKLGHKLVNLIKWKAYEKDRKLIETVQVYPQKPKSRIFNWPKSFCFCKKSNKDFTRLVQDEKTSSVPKGHLAIYVGEKEDETKRFFIPVIYFNHPLFGDLLKWAEEEYGFGQSGGIQIPCRVSEFKRVKKLIKAAGGGIRRKRKSLKLCFSS